MSSGASENCGRAPSIRERALLFACELPAVVSEARYYCSSVVVWQQLPNNMFLASLLNLSGATLPHASAVLDIPLLITMWALHAAQAADTSQVQPVCQPQEVKTPILALDRLHCGANVNTTPESLFLLTGSCKRFRKPSNAATEDITILCRV